MFVFVVLLTFSFLVLSGFFFSVFHGWICPANWGNKMHVSFGMVCVILLSERWTITPALLIAKVIFLTPRDSQAIVVDAKTSKGHTWQEIKPSKLLLQRTAILLYIVHHKNVLALKEQCREWIIWFSYFHIYSWALLCKPFYFSYCCFPGSPWSTFSTLEKRRLLLKGKCLDLRTPSVLS